MKLTFVSNYINHHQIPVSNALHAALGDGYTFVQTEPMEEERRAMGWNAEVSALPYLKYAYESPEECRRLIMDSDIVVFGGTEEERFIDERLQAGKITIRYSERLYREGQWKAISPRGLLKKYHDHTRYRKAPVYLLCAGA
ncbi:MAG: glycosyltransferase family 1 protein, partial [Lachnospiraceae bacterium]|nr:glycosyltransferase family 1 protein [Lachnospiraceae bacterium]